MRIAGWVLVASLTMAARSSPPDDAPAIGPAPQTDDSDPAPTFVIDEGRVQSCNGYFIYHQLPPRGQTYPAWWIEVPKPSISPTATSPDTYRALTAKFFTAPSADASLHCFEYPSTEGKARLEATLTLDTLTVSHQTYEGTDLPTIEVTMTGFHDITGRVSVEDVRWLVVRQVEG